MNKLRKILDNWSISYSEIRPIKKGFVSEKWLVRTSTSDLILRNTGTNQNYTEAQIILLDYLSQNNFLYQTPKLKSTRRNTKYVRYEGHYFYMYEFIEGFPIILILAIILGGLLGGIQKVSLN